MPRLDLSQAPTRIEVTPHARFETQLRIELNEAGRDRLSEALQAVADSAGSELRLELPEGWTVFWKVKEGDNRLLLAHPDADLWVATAAMMKEELDRLVSSLSALSVPSEKISLSEMMTLSGFSNLSIVIAFVQ